MIGSKLILILRIKNRLQIPIYNLFTIEEAKNVIVTITIRENMG